MSILRDQDINNYADDSFYGNFKPVLNTKWKKNLGSGRDYPSQGEGWGGYNYGDDSLKAAFPEMTGQKGPQGNDILQGTPYKYGPEAFARQPNSTGGGGTARIESTLLTAFAKMINTTGGGTWSSGAPGSDMETTFTSGGQMRSLWDKQEVNGVPLASGGAWQGYEEGSNNEYGISGPKNDVSQELQNPRVDDIKTGIRNLKNVSGS